MPGPEQVIRAAVGLPLAVARRVFEIVGGLLPGDDGDDRPEPEPEITDVDIARAVDDAMTRERDPVEEPAPPDDDLVGHIEPEVELVAESADAEAPDPPGPELHVDEPWEGYRRMKVAEIAARLEGQSPEVLAAVELYETTHRNRPGVLEAVRAASRA